MQFRFCDKKLTAIFWHCTRACHVVLPSDPNGNPAARGYNSCSLEFRTRRLSLTADGPGTRKFVWNDGPVCVTWFPFFKVKGKSGHTNWTILWNVHFLFPLAWKTRPGECFESFVVRNCGDSFCLHNMWQNQGGMECPHSMPPWFAREAFRHLLDQNSIDKDFDRSLTPVPAAESAAESGTRKFVWNDGPVCLTWFPSYLQPRALERYDHIRDGIVNTCQPVACGCSPMISQGHSSTGRLNQCSTKITAGWWSCSHPAMMLVVSLQWIVTVMADGEGSICSTNPADWGHLSLYAIMRTMGKIALSGRLA